MATMDKIISLMKAHYERNEENFNTLSLQIAASEAKSGHLSVANEIRNLVEMHRTPTRSLSLFPDSVIGDMIRPVNTRHSIHELVVKDDVHAHLERVILEYRERNRLQRNGLQNRNKILFVGPSGTGKTMSASVIATELDLPLFVIRLDKIITKFMGATSTKLGQVFDTIEKYEGVYLFDEFDAIGADRKRENDVGEMRRILTSFLMFLESVNTESIIVAATNQIEALDSALFRRFDDVIHYSLPSQEQIIQLINIHLGERVKKINIPQIALLLNGYSQATICAVCKDAIKESILKNQIINKSLLEKVISEKQDCIIVG